MANKQEEQKTEQKPQGVSRRELLTKAGFGAAGVVAGSVVGHAATTGRQPLPVQDTWIGRNVANCTGCRLCQVACSQIKEKKVWPGIARITVHQYYPGVEFPVACYQCGEGAKCVDACPVTALSVDGSKKLNTIVVDKTRCLRTAKNSECTECLDKCPGLVVTFHPKTREPLFCDLCGGDPECIKVCPENTVTTRGVKMAAVTPAEIAAGLALNYLPAKTVPMPPGSNVGAPPPPPPSGGRAGAGRGERGGAGGAGGQGGRGGRGRGEPTSRESTIG